MEQPMKTKRKESGSESKVQVIKARLIIVLLD